MAIDDVFPIINCRDLARSEAFYRLVFHGVETYRFPEDGDAVYLVLRIGDAQIALGLGTGPAMYGEIPRPATGHAVDVCIYVPDLDRTVRIAKELGAPVPVRPEPTPWGETVAYIEDPDGTMLLTIQKAEAS